MSAQQERQEQSDAIVGTCGCGHPVVEHYASGCGWCICQVSGPALEQATEAPGFASVGEMLSPLYDEVTHRCPPEGSGVMPCCGRTPFQVPRYHRMTVDGEVTCDGS